MAKAKDWWDKTEIVGTLLSGLIIPFALVVVGQVFSDQAAARDERHQQEERTAEDGRRRIERVNALIESLSSESVQRRRLAVEWAKYLDAAKELPPQVAPVLLEVALSDPNEGVRQSAVALTAEVATGNATVRGLIADRIGPVSSATTPQLLTEAIDTVVKTADGVVSVPPCRVARMPFPFPAANCDRASATVVTVCTAPFPKTATIRATRVFTKWAGDPRPWDQAEAAVGNDGDWNGFESTFSKDVDATQTQVCVPFRQWSSHQERVARIEVTYAAGG